jgi:hypothetical protein
MTLPSKVTKQGDAKQGDKQGDKQGEVISKLRANMKPA